MADEQQLGLPSGADSNRGKPAVAAGFKVDSSSLQQLHKVWGQLIADVRLFNKELRALDVSKLDKIHAQLTGSSGAISGTGGTGGGQGGSYTNRVDPEAPTTGQATGAGAKKSGFRLTPARVAVGALALSGSYMQSHLDGFIGVDRWAQQQAQAGAPYYGGATAKNAATNFVFGNGRGNVGIGGYLSTGDFLQGASSLQNTFGLNLAGSAGGRQRLTQAATAANALGSYAAGAAATSTLGSPQAFWALQRMGIMTRRLGGGVVDPQTIAKQIVQKVYGPNPTVQQISNGMAAGAPLRVTLDSLGLDPNTEAMISRYALAQAQGGSGASYASNANGRIDRSSTANKRAGIGDSIYDYQRQLGQSSASAEALMGEKTRGELEQSFKTFASTVNQLSHILGGGGNGIVGGLTGALGIGGSAAGNVLSAAGQFGGGITQLYLMEKLLGGLRGGGLVGQGDGITGLLSRGGMGGRLLAGGGLALGGVVAGGVAKGLISGGQTRGARAKGGNIAGGALSGAGIGAGIGTMIAPGLGTAIGAGVGALGGGLLGAFGDGGGSSNPWAQGGSTIEQIEAIGKATGAIVTSSYRPGGASYHAAHEAVDFGVPGNDPAGLLKINQFWASKYGSELAELIYTGPGGVTIKNGKVVPPDQWNSFWGSSTVEEHKNHVHVAATPASLRMGGGGVSGGASGVGGSSKSAQSSSSGSGSASFSGGNPFSNNFGSTDLQSAYSGLWSGSANGGQSASAVAKSSTNTKSSTSTNKSSTPTVSGTAVQMGKQLAAARGWTGAEWDALYQLWQHESNWNPTIANKSSGAYGIPQALPGDKMASAGADWRTNAATQEKWGMDYIAGRYGSPTKAWAFWQRTDPRPSPGNWYRTGTYRTQEGPAYLHDDEMVLNKGQSDAFRAYASKRQQFDLRSPNLPHQQGGGVRPISITVNAPITLAGTATQSDASQFLSMVKASMADDEMFQTMGMGG